MPKIQSPAGAGFFKTSVYQTLNQPTKTPETKLWRAVLGQVLYDAFGPMRYDTSKKEREEALDFLKDYSNEHFIELCENAEFDPEYIKRKVRKKFAEKFVSAINKLSTKVRNKND